MSTTFTARRVTINKTVQVHEILSIYDYTASEISAAWYDEDEMDKITQRCFKILNKFESQKSTNSPKYCMRGLEGHTKLGSTAKNSNRSAAYTAVLGEQERHWNETEDIRFQAISDAYRQTSSSCQMWAQVVGNRDQQAVEGYLYEDEEDVVTKPTPAHTPKSTDVVSSGSRIGSKLPSPLTGPFAPRARAA